MASENGHHDKPKEPTPQEFSLEEISKRLHVLTGLLVAFHNTRDTENTAGRMEAERFIKASLKDIVGSLGKQGYRLWLAAGGKPVETIEYEIDEDGNTNTTPGKPVEPSQKLSLSEYHKAFITGDETEQFMFFGTPERAVTLEAMSAAMKEGGKFIVDKHDPSLSTEE